MRGIVIPGAETVEQWKTGRGANIRKAPGLGRRRAHARNNLGLESSQVKNRVIEVEIRTQLAQPQMSSLT